VLLDWARIVDCGDAPLTFLVGLAREVILDESLMCRKDNTAALKQLDKAHKASCYISSRPAFVPDILTGRIRKAY
jgi:agmatinase